MQTTDSLKHALEVLKTESIFNETLQILEKNGIVENIEEWPMRTRILNKKYGA
jgi:hypothetical protein